MSGADASQSSTVELGAPISLADLVAIARDRRPVALAADARERVAACRHVVDAIAEAGDEAPAVYGVNTGFGALAETRIGAGDIAKLQRNLVRSHACGVGPDLTDEQVRAMMVLRAQVIAMGHSGVRVEVVDLLIAMLNAGVCPRVPAQGSVGASGDLAPLAHLALGLIGEGEARYEGELMDAGRALDKAELQPLSLAAKEGIALINGTQYMTALGALSLCRIGELCIVADIAGAVCVEALLGSRTPFDERLMQVRPHPGQATVARNMRALLPESEIMRSHADCGKVQDPYSLRCMPQVHGATRDAIGWATDMVARELNSVTDNPLVFAEDAGGGVVSAGNFNCFAAMLASRLRESITISRAVLKPSFSRRSRIAFAVCGPLNNSSKVTIRG